MSIVGIEKCDSYEYSQVEKAVFKCLDGIEALHIKMIPGSRVLLKVNLLKKNRPEDAVTTHPAVVEAIVRYLQKAGCKVILGDSPAGPFIKKSLENIYKASGMMEVAERTGCELNYDTSVVEVMNHRAKMLKNMQIINVVEEVDFVVSAAKLKTHGMMTFTGAVKNLFGIIPGLIKAEYHFKMNDEANFAQHLVDICEYVRPVFSVIDGIEGMEGNGPSAGEKRQVGLIFASTDPYAVDTVASQVIGIRPEQVPTVKVAAENGLGSTKVGDIHIRGVQLHEITLAPFKMPDSINVNFVGGRIPKPVEKYLVNTFRAKPKFDYNTCISCGHCERSCPPGIIDMESGKPIPNLNKCIACFCCHEVCPKKAIEIQKHWLHRVLFR